MNVIKNLFNQSKQADESLPAIRNVMDRIPCKKSNITCRYYKGKTNTHIYCGYSSHGGYPAARAICNKSYIDKEINMEMVPASGFYDEDGCAAYEGPIRDLDITPKLT